MKDDSGLVDLVKTLTQPLKDELVQWKSRALAAEEERDSLKAELMTMRRLVGPSLLPKTKEQSINELEAMARGAHGVLYHPLTWQAAPSHIKDQCFAIARAAAFHRAQHMDELVEWANEFVALEEEALGDWANDTITPPTGNEPFMRRLKSLKTILSKIEGKR